MHSGLKQCTHILRPCRTVKFSLQLATQFYSQMSLKRCKLVANVSYAENMLANCYMETCICQFYDFQLRVETRCKLQEKLHRVPGPIERRFKPVNSVNISLILSIELHPMFG